MSTRRKYGKAASRKVEKVLHAFKRGELKSGRRGTYGKRRTQVIAIGLSEARRAGAEVPRKRSA